MTEDDLKALLKRLTWTGDRKNVNGVTYYNAAKSGYRTIYLGRPESLDEDAVRTKISKAVRKK